MIKVANYSGYDIYYMAGMHIDEPFYVFPESNTEPKNLDGLVFSKTTEHLCVEAIDRRNKTSFNPIPCYTKEGYSEFAFQSAKITSFSDEERNPCFWYTDKDRKKHKDTLYTTNDTRKIEFYHPSEENIVIMKKIAELQEKVVSIRNEQQGLLATLTRLTVADLKKARVGV